MDCQNETPIDATAAQLRADLAFVTRMRAMALLETIALKRELLQARRERDMLARRAADLAHQLADLISPPKPRPDGDVHTAIAAMQRQGLP